MKLRVIGSTNDPWALALAASIPRTAEKRTMLLVGSQAQILLTFLGWLAGFRVLWLGSHDEYSGVAKTLIRIMSRCAAAILAPNQATEAQYLKAEVPGKKLALIYPPYEPKLPARARDNAFVIACDGEIGVERGLGLVMRGVKDAQDILGNIRLVIGGDIRDRGRIEWLAHELGLREALQLVPARGFDWIASCDIFLLMRNTGAPVPLSLAHALAYGKPIIANDALPHREFVVHHKNGILLGDANSDMLSQAIINLARKPAWREELARASALFAQERFSQEAAQKKMRALIP